MIKNEILKNIENIILSKQERKSRYISAINSLFENVYTAYKLNYCLDDDTIFNERIEDIVEDWMIPDTSFEKQNLFLIKRLILKIFNDKLFYVEFYNKINIEDLFSLDIEFEQWDQREMFPRIVINRHCNVFTKLFNNWYNSPIFIDENGVVKLFDTYGDKRFGVDKDYFDKLDTAKLGTYLIDFSRIYDKFDNLAKVIEDNLNYRN